MNWRERIVSNGMDAPTRNGINVPKCVNAEVNLTHLPPERRSKSDPPRSLVAMVVRGGRSPERTIIAARVHGTAAALLAV